MRQERPPEIKIRKETEQTAETQTDETLFEGLFNFKPPTPKDLKEISEYKEKLAEFKDPFPFRPGEERKIALKMLGSGKFEQNRVIDMVESPDFIVRDIAIEWLDELNNLSEQNIGRLEKVLERGKWKGKDRDLAERIEKKIEQFNKKGAGEGITAAEKHLSSEETVTAIETLKNDLRYEDKLWAYLYPQEEKAVKEIKELIVNLAEKEGEKAIPVLKKLAREKNRYVSWLAAEMLVRIIKAKDEDMLDETFKGYGKEIKGVVNFEKNQTSWLLPVKERFLATGDRKKLTEGLLGVKKIYQQLQEKYGDKIIGTTIGSGGGYFTKGLSDIDFAIIAKEEVLKEMFDEHGSKIPSVKIKGIADFHARFVGVGKNDAVIESAFDAIPYLFSGRLLETSPEDRQRFNEVQKNTLENLNEDKWDAVRKMYRDDEADAVEKIGLRFGINKKNLEKLKQIIFLKNIPPTLKETLEILESKK